MFFRQFSPSLMFRVLYPKNTFSPNFPKNRNTVSALPHPLREFFIAFTCTYVHGGNPRRSGKLSEGSRSDRRGRVPARRGNVLDTAPAQRRPTRGTLGAVHLSERARRRAGIPRTSGTKKTPLNGKSACLALNGEAVIRSLHRSPFCLCPVVPYLTR